MVSIILSLSTVEVKINTTFKKMKNVFPSVLSPHIEIMSVNN